MENTTAPIRKFNPKQSCLVLLAHGSKNPQWSIPFKQLAENIRRKTGEGNVYLAYMESSEPLLPEVAREIVRQGAMHIRALPLFLSSGNHMSQDIPELLDVITKEHPGLKVDLLPPIGQHPRFAALLEQLVLESL